jgi:hypothetical protein
MSDKPVVSESSTVTVQNIAEGNVDTVDTNYRYLGYGARLRTCKFEGLGGLH